MLHHTVETMYLWDEAEKHYTEIVNFSKTNFDRIEEQIGPMNADCRICDARAQRDDGEDPLSASRSLLSCGNCRNL